MEKSNIVDLDIILRRFSKKNGKSTYDKLCTKILSLRRADFNGDYEQFAAEMVERYQSGEYPFNLK